MPRIIHTLQGASLAFVLGLAITVGTLLTRQHAPRAYVDILKSRMTDEELDAVSKSSWENIQVTRDGTPVILRSYFSRRRPDDVTSEFFDLQRNPIEETLAGELKERLLPHVYVSSTRILEIVLDEPIPLASRLTQLGWDREGTEAWYFVYGGPACGQGPGWFEGYDRRTRKSLGCLGTNGLTDDRPRKAECFQVVAGAMTYGLSRSLQSITFARYTQGRDALHKTRSDVALDDKTPTEESQVLILSEGQVWSVDLQERAVRPFSDDASVQTISVALRYDPLPDDHPSRKLEETVVLREFVALRLDDRVKFTNPKLGEPFELPIPKEIRDSQFSLCLLPDRSGIAISYPPVDTDAAEGEITVQNHRIVRVNPDGAQESWTAKTERSPRPPSLISKKAQWWLGVWQTPAPLPSLASMTLAYAALKWPDPQLSYCGLMLDGFENAWPGLAALSLFSGVLVWLADRRLANHRLPRSYVWLTFVLLFGLPGYIGFLLHRKWPVKEPVPAPQKTGIEVFA